MTGSLQAEYSQDEKDLFLDPESLVYLVEAGSITHGTKAGGAHSDYDIRGVFVGPLDSYIGLSNVPSTVTRENKDKKIDAVSYEIKKFMQLLVSGNPSILEHIFVDTEHVLYTTKVFHQMVVMNRASFLSQKVYTTFTGYAYNQLVGLDRSKSTRDLGEKRKELVEKFGYDTKNAMHLFRLLYMAVELLTEGTFTVKRPEAKFLKGIRDGAWTIEHVKKEAKVLFDHLQDLKETGQIILPKEPNYDLANLATMSVINDQLAILE